MVKVVWMCIMSGVYEFGGGYMGCGKCNVREFVRVEWYRCLLSGCMCYVLNEERL